MDIKISHPKADLIFTLHCSNCGSTDFKMKLKGNDFHFQECLECGRAVNMYFEHKKTIVLEIESKRHHGVGVYCSRRDKK